MMIKLTAAGNEMMELWLNTAAISSVFQPSGKEQDMGIGSKIYITGEENSPWLVREPVTHVIHLIEGVS